MKKNLAALLALALLFCLTACGAGQAAPAETSAPVAEETLVPTAEPEIDKTPVLSPGAATDASLSGQFQLGADGTVYTTLVRADGVTYLPDLLPADVGYIAGFLRADGGFYVAVKDGALSFDPAALYYYPDEGEGHLITDDFHPGAVFCLSGGALFFKTYEDPGLWRLAGPDAAPEKVLDGDVWLVGADSGFLYYTRDGGVCRNDSTMSAEVRLFDDEGVIRLYAGENGLCDLCYTADGVALEFRAPDSALRTRQEFSAGSDSLLCRGGRVYLAEERSILVFSLEDGAALDPIALPEAQSYVSLHCAADDALYYEAFDGEVFRLYRLPLDGGEPVDLGESLEF